MNNERPCAACGKTLNICNPAMYKRFAHLDRIRYACNNQCVRDYYHARPKTVVADLAQIQGQARIVNAAREAHTAWLAHNADRLAPDLSNHYTARQQSTDFAHAMLALGLALGQDGE